MLAYGCDPYGGSAVSCPEKTGFWYLLKKTLGEEQDNLTQKHELIVLNKREQTISVQKEYLSHLCAYYFYPREERCRSPPRLFFIFEIKENGGQAYGKTRQTAGFPENVSGGQQ